MHKDFHLYGTYLAARFAGFDKDQAASSACAAEAVDDFTYGEYGSFKGLFDMGTTFRDEPKNILQTLWPTFHFLPSGIGKGIANNRISKELQFSTAPSGILFDKLGTDLTETFARSGTTEYTLAQAGVTMHVLADTFAHQGFSGIISDTNTVENVSVTMNEGKDIKIGNPFLSGTRAVPASVADIFDSTKIGHGTASGLPDISWIEYIFSYKYESDRNKTNMEYRHNPTIFTEAFVKMYEVLRAVPHHGQPIIDLKDSDILTVLEREHTEKTADFEKWYTTKNIISDGKDDVFKRMMDCNKFGSTETYTSKDIDNQYNNYKDAVNKDAKESTNKDSTAGLVKNDFLAATVWHRGNVMPLIWKYYPDFPQSL